MKQGFTQRSTHTQPFLLRRTALIACVSLIVVAQPEKAFSQASDADVQRQHQGMSGGAEVSLGSYFATINTLLAEPTRQTYATAREAIAATRDQYSKQLETLVRIVPPKEVQVSHRDLVVALAAQAKAAADAVSLTPINAPNDNANLNGYSHKLPDTGYARNDEAAAGCDLKLVADTLGYALQVAGFCGDRTLPRPTAKTLGSAQQPVNDVYMIQDLAYDPASGQPRPNVDGFQYTTIYVKAGRPLRIVFDNRNPEPFVFNIALYRNSSSTARLKGSQLVVESSAYAGYKVHSISTTLEPGVYAYVDNVHPTVMKGQLIAVP